MQAGRDQGAREAATFQQGDELCAEAGERGQRAEQAGDPEHAPDWIHGAVVRKHAHANADEQSANPIGCQGAPRHPCAFRVEPHAQAPAQQGADACAGTNGQREAQILGEGGHANCLGQALSAGLTTWFKTAVRSRQPRCRRFVACCCCLCWAWQVRRRRAVAMHRAVVRHPRRRAVVQPGFGARRF